jgi:hypothetical protein
LNPFFNSLPGGFRTSIGFLSPAENLLDAPSVSVLGVGGGRDWCSLCWEKGFSSFRGSVLGPFSRALGASKHVEQGHIVSLVAGYGLPGVDGGERYVSTDMRFVFREMAWLDWTKLGLVSPYGVR